MLEMLEEKKTEKIKPTRKYWCWLCLEPANTTPSNEGLLGSFNRETESICEYPAVLRRFAGRRRSDCRCVTKASLYSNTLVHIPER